MAELEVVVPKWGLTMTEAIVVRWLKGPGDAVDRGDPIVELETEKASAEVESPESGTVARLLHEPGAVVAVGEALAVLEVASAAFQPRPPAAPRPGARRPVAQAPSAPAAPGARDVPARREGSGRASPVARRVAKELGVDLTTLVGSGPRGLITEADVRGAAGPPCDDRLAGALEIARKEKLTGRRAAIGAALSANLATSPQVTLTRSADATGLTLLKERADARFSLNDLLVAAVAVALAEHPRLNAQLVDDELWFFDQVNIGLAVDLDDGLIVPVLRDVQARSLEEIRAERVRLVDAVSAGTISSVDLVDGTFTITNLGGWGVDAFTPIINPPQVGILGVGRLEERAVVAEGQVRARQEITLSLTFDHRALDGRGAAEFLADLSELLADVERLASAARLAEGT